MFGLPCRNTVGSFSAIFLDRVYEEHVTSQKSQRGPGYPNQMDFGAFLDFMLAWDNRNSWAGIQYFFPVLDLKGRGYLTQVEALIDPACCIQALAPTPMGGGHP